MLSLHLASLNLADFPSFGFDGPLRLSSKKNTTIVLLYSASYGVPTMHWFRNLLLLLKYAVAFNLPVLANMKNDIQINTTDTFCKPVYSIRYSYCAKGRTTE